MSLKERLAAMFGLKTQCKETKVDPALSRAIQRNEQASVKAQAALERLRMSETLSSIARKM